MGLETATYLDALVVSNPDGADARSTADDHLRLIKASLKRTFPQLGGAVSASAQAISYVNDLSASAQAQLNALRDGSATARAALVATTAVSASSAAALGGVAASDFARLSQQNYFTRPQRVTTNGEPPFLWLERSDNVAGHRAWLLGYVGPSSLAFYAENDIGSDGYPWLIATRSQTFVELISFAGGQITFNGLDLTNPQRMANASAGAYARLDVAQTFQKGVGSTPVAAADAAIIQINMENGNVHRVTLGGNRTLGAPFFGRPGQVLVLIVQQDAVGGRTLAWPVDYRFPGGSVPVLSTAAGAIDVFSFIYDSATGYWLQAGLNVTR